MVTCDVRLIDGTYCTNEMVYFGRWIGYCEGHKKVGAEIDHEKTFDNEVSPSLESGDMSYLADNPDLAEYII